MRDIKHYLLRSTALMMLLSCAQPNKNSVPHSIASADLPGNETLALQSVLKDKKAENKNCYFLNHMAILKWVQFTI